MLVSRAFWTILGVAVAVSPTLAADGIQPEQLRCEHLVDPLGVDSPQPRLGWILRATPVDLRGQTQTAYQILVAASPETLRGDRGDLWDSGKVRSDQSVEVVYSGSPLRSHAQCFWKVRVWDAHDAASAWSAPAMWTMGILDPKEWKAEWIGYHNPSQVVRRSNPKDWGQDSPSPVFRRGFAVSKPLRRAVATICGLGYYELYLNGSKVGDRVLDPIFTRYDKRILYATYDVTKGVASGKNALGVMLGNGWYNQHAKDVWYFEKSPWRDRPRLLMQLRLEYADGAVETIASDLGR